MSPRYINGQNATVTFTLSYDGEDREITYSGTKLRNMQFQAIENRTLTITGCSYITQIGGTKEFEVVLHLAGNETYAPATTTISADSIGDEYTIVEI